MTQIRPIGAGAHLLHIGPHKTGSTAIQLALFRARDRLAQHGVYYPGQKRRRREASEELFAAVKRGTSSPTPAWDALVAEVTDQSAMRVCVSDELFGKGSLDQAARVVRDLGGDEPHVVAVARGYDRYLPSQWQERVKAGVTASYDTWLRTVFDPGSTTWERQNVWHAHDTAALVERWTTLVAPASFTVIVADERDRDQLPRTFEALLGLPGNLLQTRPGRSNESLSLAQVELVRAVGVRLRDRDLPAPEYRRLMKRAVREARSRMAKSGPGRPQTPPWARELIAERSARRIEFLTETDVNVVGDPGWLEGTPVGEPIPGEADPVTVEPSEDVVSDLVAELVRQD